MATGVKISVTNSPINNNTGRQSGPRLCTSWARQSHWVTWAGQEGESTREPGLEASSWGSPRLALRDHGVGEAQGCGVGGGPVCLSHRQGGRRQRPHPAE